MPSDHRHDVCGRVRPNARQRLKLLEKNVFGLVFVGSHSFEINLAACDHLRQRAEVGTAVAGPRSGSSIFTCVFYTLSED